MTIIAKNLTREHLERFPVWAYCESPDDLHFIRMWGAMGAEIADEILEARFSDAYQYPVLELDDGWEWSPGVCIRADITAADGTKFAGYVGDASVFHLSVFAADDTFGFNIHCEDFADQTLLRLRNATGHPLSPFFPLRYEVAFPMSSGQRIEGFFGYGDQVSWHLLAEYGVHLQRDDVVRVTSLHSADRRIYEAERPPRIGDIGRIIACYDPGQHTAPFLVSCIHQPNGFYETLWQATFATHELELTTPSQWTPMSNDASIHNP